MENNKEIHKIITAGKVTEFNATDESLTVKIGEDTYKFYTYHDQDCCESVYGDFSPVKYYKDQIIDKEVTNIVIKSVKGMGFLLCFGKEYSTNVKIFIACYNVQNGYYSSNLSLVIENNNVKTTIDISELVEDDIN